MPYLRMLCQQFLIVSSSIYVLYVMRMASRTLTLTLTMASGLVAEGKPSSFSVFSDAEPVRSIIGVFPYLCCDSEARCCCRFKQPFHSNDSSWIRVAGKVTLLGHRRIQMCQCRLTLSSVCRMTPNHSLSYQVLFDDSNRVVES